jgi:dimethylglycine dehydrogenase
MLPVCWLYFPDQTMSQINRHSIELYNQLEAETGQPVGFHQCGQLRLATSQDRLDEYRAYLSFARRFDIECEIISRQEAQKLWPVANFDDVVAALFHPTDGHIAPADLTQAMALAARRMGAKFHLNTEVAGIKRTLSGEGLCVASRKVIWLFSEQVRLEFVPVLHCLQGSFASEG